MGADFDKLALLAKTTAILSADAVQKANSGHPGMPMGASGYSSLLGAEYLRFNPQEPSWQGRDRFVLSAGHGSMLLYSLLHLFGYDLSLDQIKAFRQWDSITPGHPEFGLTPGVETTTGPLGQGFANGVGMALSSKLLAERYDSNLFSYRVFGVVSDGDLMEGVAAEAASLAGHLALGNLVYLYDDNHISIGGDTEVCFREDVPKRFEAYGWDVHSVDGHDLDACDQAITKAISNSDKPSLICARTTIGFGSPNKAGKANSHGEPLGEEELKLTKQTLGWDTEKSFYIPSEVSSYCQDLVKNKVSDYEAWQSSFESWKGAKPDLAKLYASQSNREIQPSLKASLLDAFGKGEPKKVATRNLSGEVLQLLAKELPGLIGGSADLEPSNKTLIKDSSDVQATDFSGRNLRFGVREHAMGAIANGLAYGRDWVPYTATFLIFSDYMRPSIRLAALSHLQTLFIFTHDSFWVGEDGPTHQPIEHIWSLRLIPNLYVFRPADALETALCYYQALQLKKSPSALLFTRQGVEPLQRESSFNNDDILKGGYVVSAGQDPKLVIVATGSEVSLALEAAKLLEQDSISARVVSIPCLELFLEQDQSYQDSVIPPQLSKVSLECGATSGWERIIGDSGLKIGIDHFGASAPGQVLAKQFGFDCDSVAEKIRTWL